jgi:Ca2+-binding RTX toxin-like protein
MGNGVNRNLTVMRLRVSLGVEQMAIHVIGVGDAEKMTGTQVTNAHFGANLVTTTGTEFVNPETPEYAEMVVNAGITTLRYPGGSVTEQYMDMTNPNADKSAGSIDHPATAITPMDQFFGKAGQISIDVTLVIPTSTALKYSAGEAAERSANGETSQTYGNRTALREGYLDEVKSYVQAAMDEAVANGVSITAFEIGNEFWGGAVKMTAAEYGIAAGNVAVTIQEVIADAIAIDASYSQFLETEIIVQSTRSANEWSPRNDTMAYIQYIDGIPYAREQSDYKDAQKSPNFNSADWVSFLVPGQGGTPGPQSNLIADGILSVDGAATAIDGVLFHYYISGGVESVNDSQTTIFNELLTNFESRLELPSGKLSQHVTEWNPRAGGQDTTGLAQASMISEMLYEMVRNGVDAAQIWPLSFDQTANRTLIDEGEGRLTIAGEMFRIMSETLVNTKPIFDFVADGELAVHGYGAADGLTFFVSDRDGVTGQETLVLTNFVDPSASYFLVITELWDGGSNGQDPNLDPVLNYYNGIVTSGTVFNFTMQNWANLRIEVTYVTGGDDYIEGRGGDDNIYGHGGSDTLIGGEGNDSLNGNGGDDSLIDGHGIDQLTGGSGADRFVLSYDGLEDIITDFDPNVDSLDLSSWPAIDDINNLSITQLSNGVRISYKGEVLDVLGVNGTSLTPDLVRAAIVKGPAWDGLAIDQDFDEGSGDECIEGSFESDMLIGTLSSDLIVGYQGDDTIYGGGNNDTLIGGMNNDLIFGGGGNDNIRGGDDADSIYGEAGDDFIQGGDGEDLIVGGGGDNKLFGQRGEDTLMGGSQNDTLNSGGGSDFLSGGKGNDWFRAGNSDDTLWGGDGRDTMFGNSENDILLGGAGDDRLFGGGGEDTLQGGPGNDFLKGGEGADTFIFEAGMGADELLGFSRIEDTLQIDSSLLNGETTGAQVLAAYGTIVGKDVVLDFGNGEVITLLWANSMEGIADDILIV